MRMKSVLLLIGACLLLGCSDASAKYADLAGSWYTDSPQRLREEIDGYLAGAEVEELDGDVIAVISPHAGLAYSGQVAAYAFNTLRQSSPETVIVVGFTHRRYIDGTISVFTGEAFTTPLGRTLIDRETTNKLLAYDDAIKDVPRAFSGENSVEMQIPFLQASLPEAKLVLVAIADQNIMTSRTLAHALYEVMKDDRSIALVASADLSHYLSYDDAVIKDTATINEIKKFSPDDLYLYSLSGGHDAMCGPGAVYAVMLASKKMGASEVTALKYANSGDITGDKARVVGYFSAAFTRTGGNPGGEHLATQEGDMFDESQRKELLGIARGSIEHYLETGREMDIASRDEAIERELGAFVTLHLQGQLRGCIGSIEPRGPLYLTIRDMAVASAFNDPRFRPLDADELDRVDIEISVLSPMRRVLDPDEIEMGKHGVLVRRGARSGVYLPQVATETGWDREEFMSSLCAHKAGIPHDAWKTGLAEIYIFTSEVFGESEYGPVR